MTTPRIELKGALSGKPRRNSAHALAVRVCKNHALNTDIVVQPNTPMDFVFVVQTELRAKYVIAGSVDFFGILVQGWIGVYRSELAILDGRFQFAHDFSLFEELAF